MRTSIFLILLTLSISQNIITSWNYDKVKMYDIQKINSFLLTRLVNLCDNLPNELPELNNIKVSNLKIVGIETNLYDSLLNYHTGLFLFTPNKITLYFNFSYTDKTKGYDNVPAQLELKIATLKIKVKNDIINKKPTISSTMSSILDNFNVAGIPDKEFLKLLKDTLFSGFNNLNILSGEISDKINIGLMNYFEDYYTKNEELKIVTTEFFGKFKFSTHNNIFQYFCQDLLADNKNGFCFTSGYSSHDEEEKDKTSVPLSNERFSHNENDSYNFFINQDMIYDIFNYVTNSYLTFTPKIYDKTTKIKELSYDFNVASLKKYFDGLENLKDDEEFSCEVYIDNFTFYESIYRVKFVIGNNAFSIKINSKIQVGITLKRNTRFNLCLDDVKTNSVEVLSNEGEMKVVIHDLDLLKNAIDESFDLEAFKICLTDEGINMGNYFSKIKSIYLEDQGLFLEGSHLYQ